jgi:hypothetical protein
LHLSLASASAALAANATASPIIIETIDLCIASLAALASHVVATPSLRMVFGPVMLLIAIRSLEDCADSHLEAIGDLLVQLATVDEGVADVAWERIIQSALVTVVEKA